MHSHRDTHGEKDRCELRKPMCVWRGTCSAKHLWKQTRANTYVETHNQRDTCAETHAPEGTHRDRDTDNEKMCRHMKNLVGNQGHLRPAPGATPSSAGQSETSPSESKVSPVLQDPTLSRRAQPHPQASRK